MVFDRTDGHFCSYVVTGPASLPTAADFLPFWFYSVAWFTSNPAPL